MQNTNNGHGGPSLPGTPIADYAMEPGAETAGSCSHTCPNKATCPHPCCSKSTVARIQPSSSSKAKTGKKAHSAVVSTVLGTGELFESILFFLPEQDLLRMSQVRSSNLAA